MPPTEEYRYPGPNEFEDTPASNTLFSGRNSEMAGITQQIIASRLLVLYGNSGLGKSSILKAAVFPKLREQGFFPMHLRIDPSAPALESILRSCEAAAVKAGLDFTPGEGTTAWEFFKTVMFWRGSTLLYPVLVFDQFEELFTLATSEWRNSFAREIGPLVSGNLPDVVRRRLEIGESGLNDTPPNVKTVFSIREEFYGSLEELTSEFPTLFQDRCRLLALSRTQAQEAIEAPASKPSGASFTLKSPSFVYTPEALKQMLDFLAGGKESVEPFQLQLLCQHIERVIVPGKGRAGRSGESIKVTAADVGDEQSMSAIVRSFYTDSINRLPLGERRRARELCDTGLLSPDGRRLMRERTEILRDYSVREETLDSLAKDRVLRVEPRMGSLFYEIGHDTIARSILTTRPWRLSKQWRIALESVAVGCLCIAVLVVWHFMTLKREQAQTSAARTRAERLVSILIGEELLEKIRPMGKLEVLDYIQKNVDASFGPAADDESVIQSRNRGLAHLNKGKLYYARFDLEHAREEYEEAERIFNRLTQQGSDAEWRHDLADAKASLADVFQEELQLERAHQLGMEALRIQQKLIRETKAGDKLLRDEAESYFRLGDIRRQQGHLTDAKKQFELAIRATESHGETEWLYIRQDGFSGKGESLITLGDDRNAEHCFTEALRCARKAVEQSPFAPEARYRLGVAHNKLLFLPNQEPNVVVQTSRSLHESVNAAAGWDPSNARMQRDLAATYILLGEGLAYSKDMRSAAASYQQAVDRFDKLLKKSPNSAKLKLDLDLVWLRQSLGDCLQRESGGFVRDVAQRANVTFRPTEVKEPLVLGQADRSPAGTSPRQESGAEGVQTERAVAPFSSQAPGGSNSARAAIEQYDLALDMARRIAVKADPSFWEIRDTAVDVASRKAELLLRENRLDDAVATCNQALAELGENPPDSSNPMHPVRRARLTQIVGDVYRKRGDLVQAEAFYSRAEQAWRAALARILGGANYHNAFFLFFYDHVAPLSAERQDTAGTLRAYRESAKAVERAIALEPQNAVYYANLSLAYKKVAGALGESGDPKVIMQTFRNAEKAQRRAVELARMPDKAIYANRLFLLEYDAIAPLCLKQNDAVGGRNAYIESAAAAEKAVALDPKKEVYRYNLALAWEKVGDAWLEGHDLQKTGEAYRKSERVIRSAIELVPGKADLYNELFLLYYDHIAKLRLARKDREGALDAYDESARAVQRAVEIDTESSLYRSNLGYAQWAIARMHADDGRFDQAESSFETSVSSFQESIRLDPKNPARWDTLYSVFHNGWAPLRVKQKRTEGALSLYRKGLDAISHAVELDPKNAVYYRSASLSHYRIGRLLGDQGELNLAADAYARSEKGFQTAISLNPTAELNHELYIITVEWLSPLRSKLNDWQGSLDALRVGAAAASKAAALRPGEVDYHNSVGWANLELALALDSGDHNEALNAYRRAEQSYRVSVSLKEDDASAWDGLGLALEGIAQDHEAAGRQTPAVATYRDALKAITRASDLDPSHPEYSKQARAIEARLRQLNSK